MSKVDERPEILIFIPAEASNTASRDRDPSTEEHALGWFGGNRVERVNAKIMDQWEDTIDRLMQMSSLIGSKAKDWTADEIEVGFTLSAKGELLFIAEAGAEASITVKLKRKNSSE